MNTTHIDLSMAELLDAGEGLLAAGQASITDHLSALRAEALEDLHRWVLGAGELAAAGALLGFGWFLLVFGAWFALGRVVGPAAAAALFGTLHLAAGVVGGGAAWVRIRERRPPASRRATAPEVSID